MWVPARRFAVVVDDITRVMTALLVASTVCTVCGTTLAASALAAACGPRPRRLAFSTLGFAAVSIFFGELLPKTLGVQNAERIARAAIAL